MKRLLFICCILGLVPFTSWAQNAEFNYPRTLSVDEDNGLLYVGDAYAGNIFVYELGKDIEETLNPTLVYQTKFPWGSLVDIESDPSTGFTYAVYMLPHRIIYFDGARIRDKDYEPGQVAFSEAERSNISRMRIFPMEDGERILIVKWGTDPKVSIASYFGETIKDIALDRDPVDVIYDALQGQILISYGVGFPVITRIDLQTEEREEIITPYSVGKITLNNVRGAIVAADALGRHVMTINLQDKNINVIDTPFQAHFLGVDSLGDMYLGNYFENDILVLQDKESLRQVPINLYPIAFEIANEKLVVVGHTGEVDIITLSSISSQELLATSIDTAPRQNFLGLHALFSILTIDPQRNLAFVLNEDKDELTIINLSTGNVSSLETSVNSNKIISHPTNAAFWKNTVFLANFSGFISVFETESEAFLGKIEIGEPVNDIVSFGEKVYAASGNSKRIYVIDPASRTISKEIPLDGSGWEERVGRLNFSVAGETPESPLFSVYDQVSGSWAYINSLTDKLLLSGKGAAMPRPPILFGDLLIEASFNKSVVTFSRIRERNIEHMQDVALPQNVYPLFYSLDTSEREVIVFASNNTSGDAFVFILTTDGLIKKSFRVGKSTNGLTHILTGQYAPTEIVFSAFYTNYTDAVWVVTIGRIDIYTKDGAVRKSILHSGIPLVLSDTGNRLYTFGIGEFDELDLTESALTRSWNYRTNIPFRGIVNGPIISRVSSKKDVGIALIPMHNSFSYLDYKADKWHTIFTSEIAELPNWVELAIENGEKIPHETGGRSRYYYFVLAFIAVIAFGSLIVLKRLKASSSKEIQPLG